jgi:hypothetical protein
MFQVCYRTATVRESVNGRLYTASEGIGARVIFSRWKLIYVPVLRGSNRFQARSYARGAVRSEPCQLINCCFVRGIIAT